MDKRKPKLCRMEIDYVSQKSPFSFLLKINLIIPSPFAFHTYSTLKEKNSDIYSSQ